METVTYAGRTFEVGVVAEINLLEGRCEVRHNPNRRGDERLLRDAAGWYYLMRETFAAGIGLYAARENPDEHGYRRSLHRVSVNAAILYATLNMGNGNSWDLRCDASNLLTEGRGYYDPRERSLEEASVLLDANPALLGCAPGDAAPTTFTLDDHAANLLSEHVAINSHHDPRDVVNGAAHFMLTTEADFPECVVDAKARRLDAEEDRSPMLGNSGPVSNTYGVSQATFDAAARYAAKAGRTVDEMITDLLECVAGDNKHVAPASGADDVKAAAKDEVKRHEQTEAGEKTRFTFDYEPTERRCGGRRVIELDPEQMTEAARFAPVFGLTVPEYLRLLLKRGLPNQPAEMDPLGNETFDLSCLDDAVTFRIKRAAQFRSVSAGEFVADAVSGSLTCYEDDMIVHPQTGELLGDRDDAFEEVAHKMTAAPIGRENDPSFRLQTTRQHVSLSVWLTPEQMERVEFPHMVYNAATDTEVPCALIPLDPEGNIVFRVDGKEVKPSEPIVETANAWPASDGHVVLDEEATRLVRERAEQTGEWAIDIINGAIVSDLSAAETDDEITADEISRARCRRTGETGEVNGADDGDSEDGEAEVDAAVAHMRRVLDTSETANGHAVGGGDGIKARFLSGDLPVPGHTLTVEAQSRP